MTLWEAIVLGAVQGVTEYLPVSSSAHLVLAGTFMRSSGAESPAARFAFDVFVQMGTLVGVLVFFRRDIADVARAMWASLRDRASARASNARLGWLLALATIPAVVCGLAFKSSVAAAFGDPHLIPMFLLVTAAGLAAGELGRARYKVARTIGISVAIAMGLAQAVSLLPGVSRSGATIAAAMCMGVARPEAARFSFLMSVPVMAGAGVLAIADLASLPGSAGAMLGPLLAGTLVAGVTGYFVIRWFLAFVMGRSLWWFAAYCVVAATVGYVALR